MIFKQWREIGKGIKTQTRRVKKPNDKALYHNGDIHAVYRNGRLLWQVGNEYAIQPKRTSKAIGYIRIDEIREEQLQNISPEDAMAEGCQCDSLMEISQPIRDMVAINWFKHLWNSIHRHDKYVWEANPDVWALVFEVVNEVEEIINEYGC